MGDDREDLGVKNEVEETVAPLEEAEEQFNVENVEMTEESLFLMRRYCHSPRRVERFLFRKKLRLMAITSQFCH